MIILVGATDSNICITLQLYFIPANKRIVHRIKQRPWAKFPLSYIANAILKPFQSLYIYSTSSINNLLTGGTIN